MRAAAVVLLLAGCNRVFSIDDRCTGVDYDTDPANCGSCEVACGAGESCVAGACILPLPPCSVTAPIVDPWGLTWDGLQRDAKPLDVAGVDCAATFARIPNELR